MAALRRPALPGLVYWNTDHFCDCASSDRISALALYGEFLLKDVVLAAATA
ncbi:hypothetical protein [Ktedonobacter sp. SOSP1-52]|uniref:hypothetical protein n=1 Tax=Ktedonobacter sp. SOSP1-52 TaxID=2778366 RepID=UPI001916785F|nr:hypothetical protein [Ktedonobacter sp. SOSP1-52]